MDRSRRLMTLICLVLAMVFGQCREAAAGKPAIERTIGDAKYKLRLELEDDFADLDQWLVESTGKISLEKNWLVWDCHCSGKQAGTIWCKRKFAGPTVVEFDAVAEAGARNLNFILVATHPKGLLNTTKSRSGEYGQYHKFPNYIITYLTPLDENSAETDSTTRWRIRFRKNPGFHLLSERFIETKRGATSKQTLTYVLNGKGRLQFFVNGEMLHQFEDKSAPHLGGYFGLRTWNSDVKYANFRVYSIEESQRLGARK